MHPEGSHQAKSGRRARPLPVNTTERLDIPVTSPCHLASAQRDSARNDVVPAPRGAGGDSHGRCTGNMSPAWDRRMDVESWSSLGSGDPKGLELNKRGRYLAIRILSICQRNS